MKKISKIFYFIMLAFAFAIPCSLLTACGANNHEHKYELAYDSTSHYQECSCGDKKDIEEHTVSTYEANGNGTSHKKLCSCGYEIGEEKCKFSDVIKQISGDTRYHSGLCVCGNKKSIRHLEDHIVNKGDDGHISVCACGMEFGDVYYHNEDSYEKVDSENCQAVCDCGYRFEATAHTSKYTGYDDNGHWDVCKNCETKFNEKNHTIRYDENNLSHKATCLGCNYSVINDHDFSEYTTTESVHYLVCKYCRARKNYNGESHVMDKLVKAEEGQNGHYRYCSICNYTNKTLYSHYGRYESNELEHWQVCECGEKFNKTTHDTYLYYQYIDNNQHKATCLTCQNVVKTENCNVIDSFSNYEHYKMCTICENRFEEEDHDIEYEILSDTEHKVSCKKCAYEKSQNHYTTVKEYYTSDDVEHTFNCSCGYHNTANHTWKTNEDGSIKYSTTTNNHSKCCSICLHTVYENHQSSTLLSDDTYHWNKCDICQKDELNKTEHIYDRYEKDTSDENIFKHFELCECGHHKSAESVRCTASDKKYDDTKDVYNHYVECTVCKNIISKTPHNFKSGPKCSDCGQEIPQTKVTTVEEFLAVVNNDEPKIYIAVNTTNTLTFNEEVVINKPFVFIRMLQDATVQLDFTKGLTVNGFLWINDGYYGKSSIDGRTKANAISAQFIKIAGDFIYRNYGLDFGGDTYGKITTKEGIISVKENALIDLKGICLENMAEKGYVLVAKNKTEINVDNSKFISNINAFKFEDATDFKIKNSVYITVNTKYGSEYNDDCVAFECGKAGKYSIQVKGKLYIDIYATANAKVITGNFSTEDFSHEIVKSVETVLGFWKFVEINMHIKNNSGIVVIAEGKSVNMQFGNSVKYNVVYDNVSSTKGYVALFRRVNSNDSLICAQYYYDYNNDIVSISSAHFRTWPKNSFVVSFKSGGDTGFTGDVALKKTNNVYKYIMIGSNEDDFVIEDNSTGYKNYN